MSSPASDDTQSSARSLAEIIATSGGRVTFARFMELALTHPRLGYYSRVDRLLRRGGDFSTAPALSPFFNTALARLVTELTEAAATDAPADTHLSVVELGGGEGQLAQAVLHFWANERPEFLTRVEYRIVEIGTGLRQRQREALSALIGAGCRVCWGEDLSEACVGTEPVVMIGNEFLDALPVHLIRVDRARLEELYVTASTASTTDLAMCWAQASETAMTEIRRLFGTLDPGKLRSLTTDGIIEVSSGMRVLLERIARLMPRGSLLTIDYGAWFAGLPFTGEPSGQRGAAQRRRTVRGYFRQQLMSDPLAHPGRQDLTADVDFAALDQCGRQAGFETVLFTTMTAFLRAGGAEQELRSLGALRDGTASGPGPDPLEADRQATVLRNLLDERDLGSAFKLMLQVREQT